MTDAITCTKAEFAALCGVHPSRVSHWLKDRKLTGEAIVGTGRNARIAIAVAQAQLNLRLSVSQRTGNGVATRLFGSDEVPNTDSVAATALAEAILREKLAELQSRNRKAAEEEGERSGKYTLTSEVRRQLNIVANLTVRTLDGSMPELASAMSAEFQLDEREVLTVLKDAFHRFRTRAAEVAKRVLESMPILADT